MNKNKKRNKMNAEDILDQLGTDTSRKEAPQRNNDKFDYWGDNKVSPKELVVTELNKPKKTFTVVKFSKSAATDDTKLVALATALSAKGYTFRHNGAEDDSTQNKILAIEGIRVEHYIPWKKFNPDKHEIATVKKATGEAYHVAAAYHGGFSKMSNAVRLIIATNVHALLGKDLVDPSTLMLAYNDTGIESTNAKFIDYKETGPLLFSITVSEAANIPVFNVNTDDVNERVKEFLKTKEESEPAPEPTALD